MANHRKATDGGNVYFNRRQLFIVASLFVAASTFIFVLGILIGQSIEERKLLSREEPAVQVPVKSGAPKADQEMTFYETLTKPEPAPAPTEKTPAKPAKAKPAKASPAKTSWALQVAASRSRATADNMVAELKKRGYPAYVTSGRLNQKTFYRVRVGKYETRQGAMADLQRLKSANYKNAMITRNP